MVEQQLEPKNGIASDHLRGFVEAMASDSDISVTVSVHSDATDAQIRAVGQTTTRSSPVYDSLVHPVSVQLDVQRLS